MKQETVQVTLYQRETCLNSTTSKEKYLEEKEEEKRVTNRPDRPFLNPARNNIL